MKWDLQGSFKKIDKALASSAVDAQTKLDFEFLQEQLTEFICELRDRKSEGEQVIDEFIDVLCFQKVNK